MNKPFFEKEEAKGILDYAIKKYGKKPNVLGIALGTKYQGGRPTDQQGLTFFVSKKMPPKNLSGTQLPKFIYGRFPDGRINYQHKIITDVLETGEIKLACCAGSAIEVGNGTLNHGTITLLFKNKENSDSDNYYIITCSHVIGKFHKNYISTGTESIQYPDTNIEIAEVIARTGYIKGTRNIEYDIALARVNIVNYESTGYKLADMDCKLDEEDVIFTGYYSRNKIKPGERFDCRMGKSKPKNNKPVRHYEGILPLPKWGESYNFNNLFSIEMKSRGGDSGGIIYHDDNVVGILVANSESGFSFFQPLEDAINYIGSALNGLAIRVF
ncbi:MAG: serine protease [Desulfobacterales bacterium]|nr:serine protease [Pseudomonadota bacterium]MCG2770856.1 serine protease [Desulfobacterales bacterium]